MELLKFVDDKIVANESKVLIVSKEIMSLIKEKLGDQIICDYDAKTNELTLVKKPDSYTDALTGLGEEMWVNAGGVKYLEQERKSWDS
jgi:hypothetical protein